MAWNVSGQSLELCSCKLLCPCWLGPEGAPDQGWCAGAFAFDISTGNSDGCERRPASRASGYLQRQQRRSSSGVVGRGDDEAAAGPHRENPDSVGRASLRHRGQHRCGAATARQGPGGTADEGRRRSGTGRVPDRQHGPGERQRQPVVGPRYARLGGRFWHPAPVHLECLMRPR
jgi:hypothetical protein